VAPRGPIFWKHPGPRALLDGKKTKSMLISPSQKIKLKLWRLSKVEDSMELWGASPFGAAI